MVDSERDAPSLRGIPVFEGLSDEELARVAGMGVRVEVDAGVTVVEQGRVGQEAYVVLEGHALVYVADSFLAEVGPGEPIGEMALLDHRPRTATVVAASPMTLLSLDVKHFRKLLEEMPGAKARLDSVADARALLLRERRVRPVEGGST